jgi:type I restriction enzyme S subunit
MRLNFKKLGSYIKEAYVKNSDLEIEKLLGVSITKEFIPSIANTVGTDMSKYKIVRTNQFAYGPVTSRNGDKISVALLQEDDCIISTSYTVFEIIDHGELNPEYLMMWFRRPEFDRYARFMSHGSVREIFGWDEMCDIELPVPSIEKQGEIVKEYNTIVNRIKLNEQLNQKLEETAQAVYKRLFVDYEFPDENGKPYKSSGGEMVWCEELGKEIPVGWNSGYFKSIVKILSGKSPNNKYDFQTSEYQIPIFGAGGIMGFTDLVLFNEPIISIGRVGTHGEVQRINYPCWPSDNTLVFKSLRYEYTYQILLNINYDEINRGGVQGLITQSDLKSMTILIPSENLLNRFEDISEQILSFQGMKRIEIDTINRFEQILLSKMTKVETN